MRPKKVISILLSFVFFFSTLFPSPVLAGSLPVVIDFSSVSEVLGYEPTAYLSGINFTSEDEVTFIWKKIRNRAMSKLERDTNIKFFLLALAIPDEQLWVNLNILLNDLQVLGHELLYTDIGKVLMYSDVKLKEDVQRLFDRSEFWEKLAEAGYDITSESPELGLSPRFWIVPGNMEVFLSQRGIAIKEADLEVMFELRASPKMEGSDLVRLAKDLIKKEILPELNYTVNHDQRYSLLRQVYYACIIAQWYKKYAKDEVQSLFNQLVNSGQIGGLQSDRLWSPRWYLDEYVKMYRNQIWQDYGEGWEFSSGGIYLRVLNLKKYATFVNEIFSGLLGKGDKVKAEVARVSPAAGKRWAVRERMRRLVVLLPFLVGGLLLFSSVALAGKPVDYQMIVEVLEKIDPGRPVIVASSGDQLYILVNAPAKLSTYLMGVSEATGASYELLYQVVMSQGQHLVIPGGSLHIIPVSIENASILKTIVEYDKAIYDVASQALLQVIPRPVPSWRDAVFSGPSLLLLGILPLLAAWELGTRFRGKGVWRSKILPRILSDRMRSWLGRFLPFIVVGTGILLLPNLSWASEFQAHLSPLGIAEGWGDLFQPGGGFLMGSAGIGLGLLGVRWTGERQRKKARESYREAKVQVEEEGVDAVLDLLESLALRESTSEEEKRAVSARFAALKEWLKEQKEGVSPKLVLAVLADTLVERNMIHGPFEFWIQAGMVARDELSPKDKGKFAFYHEGLYQDAPKIPSSISNNYGGVIFNSLMFE